jgi:hypothetical protein
LRKGCFSIFPCFINLLIVAAEKCSRDAERQQKRIEQIFPIGNEYTETCSSDIRFANIHIIYDTWLTSGLKSKSEVQSPITFNFFFAVGRLAK